MNDTSPINQSALVHNARPGSPRQAVPGELLFEFHVERTKKFYRIELRDRGQYGVEAQVLDPVEFLHGHLFPTRALAIAWAEETRSSMLKAVGW